MCEPRSAAKARSVVDPITHTTRARSVVNPAKTKNPTQPKNQDWAFRDLKNNRHSKHILWMLIYNNNCSKCAFTI